MPAHLSHHNEITVVKQLGQLAQTKRKCHQYKCLGVTFGQHQMQYIIGSQKGFQWATKAEKVELMQMQNQTGESGALH